MGDSILDPVPDTCPDPDCPRCGGEGRPQSQAHALLDEHGFSNKACPECWKDDDDWSDDD